MKNGDQKKRLQEEIIRLKKEKNALVMAHYYQRDEIQEVADFIGDSLALARKAAETDADIIVMCGVHFMGETAKILCPGKKVIVPDMGAGCSLADSCDAEEFRRFGGSPGVYGDQLCQHLRRREGVYRHCGHIRQRPQDSGVASGG